MTALELFAQGLDDNFFGVVDLVDDQTELAVIGLQDDDVDRAVCSWLAPIGGEFQFLMQIDQRQEPAAQAVDGRAVNQLDPLGRFVASSRTSSRRLTCGMA